MSHGWDLRMHEVEACLGNAGLSMRSVDFEKSAFIGDNGGASGLSARVEGDWLLFDAPLCTTNGEHSSRRLLGWNGSLAGAAKFVASPATALPHLRAELPLLDDEADFLGLVTETAGGFQQAAMLIRGESTPRLPAVDILDDRGGSAKDPTLLPLPDVVREAGWTFFERSPEKLAVDLDGCRGSHQAILEGAPGGAVSATVLLASWESALLESRTALVFLLFAAGGLVRMVRPVFEEDEGGMRARLEVRSVHLRNPALLDQVLSALSVACRLCGREAAVLGDAGIAGQFLAARGVAVD